MTPEWKKFQRRRKKNIPSYKILYKWRKMLKIAKRRKKTQMP
jgi:hypothetical protein